MVCLKSKKPSADLSHGTDNVQRDAEWAKEAAMIESNQLRYITDLSTY